MNILPIKSIQEEDSPVVGLNLLNLAKLARLGLPVAGGIVVIPPHIKIKTVLEHFEYRNHRQSQIVKEVFEQSLELIKKDIYAIEIPDELVKILSKQKIDPKKTWLSLLDNWIAQIKSKIWREGFGPKLTSNLYAQPIFFTQPIKLFGSAFFDPFEKKVKTEIASAKKLDQLDQTKLDKIIIEANKKLFIPQIYEWIDDGTIKIVKVSPYTGSTEELVYQPDAFVTDSELEYKKGTNLPIKIYLNLSQGLVVDRNIDGLIIEGEKIDNFEEKIWKVSELATDFAYLPVIYKLANIKNDQFNLFGTQALLYDHNFLKTESEVFLFARNKKRLLNVQLGLPQVTNCQEFSEIKKELNILGISRKGSLKMWLELSVPENFINIESYIEIGLDGIIINLDHLSICLTNSPSLVSSDENIATLLNFLEEAVKKTSKAKIPILFTGQLIAQPQVIRFMIEKGVWGAVVTQAEQSSLAEHLKFIERRLIRN